MASAAHLLVEQGRAGSAARRPFHRFAPAVPAFALACLLQAIGVQPSLGAQTVLLALAVLAAMPHGGADLVVAGRLLRPSLGWAWLPVFGAAYLTPAATMILAWATWPGLALAAFLALSALHFGLSDTAGRGEERIWAVPAWGGAPIVVPSLAHPDAVAALFDVLAGASGVDLLILLHGPFAIGWAAIAMMYVARSVALDGLARWPVLEFLAMCIGLALLPPLLAFAIYFGALHAPRALAARAAELKLEPRRLLRLATGPSVAAAAAMIAAYLILTSIMPSGGAAIRALFIGLAALTAPHMLFDALVARLRRKGGGQRFAGRERSSHE